MNSSSWILSFDLDDTLWPCMPTILEAERRHYAWLQAHVPALCDHYSEQQLYQQRRQYLADHPELAHDLSQLRLDFLASLATRHQLGEEWVQPAFEVFYQARQKVTLFDDVKPVLDKLSQSHTLLALTNGNADIQQTGVYSWFEFCIQAAQAGEKKAQPTIYQMALERLAATPQQMIHIGDDPLQDVQGAKRAGCYSIWLNRSGEAFPDLPFQPDGIIRTLFELEQAIMELA